MKHSTLSSSPNSGNTNVIGCLISRNMQADTVLRTKENGDEIWYSGDYVRKQIELAFQAGMAVGAKIEIHLMQPMSEQSIPDYTNEFWRRINVEYKNEFDKGHVWNIAGERSLNSR